MKKLLWFIILIPAIAFAGGRYLTIAMRDDASAADKIAVRDKIKTLLNPAGMNWHNIDRMADMPQWRSVANTNITWRVLNLDLKTNSATLKIPWTLEQYKAWKDANLSQPAKVQVRQSDDPKAELTAAGLEPVPTGDAP